MVRTSPDWKKSALRTVNNFRSFSSFINYVSFRTPLMQLLYFHLLRLSKGLSFQLSFAFFGCKCWRKILPKRFGYNLRLLNGRKATKCRVCFHSILRWKDKINKTGRKVMNQRLRPKRKINIPAGEVVKMSTSPAGC